MMTGTSLCNALSRFDKDDTTTKVQTNHVHLRHDDWYDEDDMATKVQTNHIHLTKLFIRHDNHKLKLACHTNLFNTIITVLFSSSLSLLALLVAS